MYKYVLFDLDGTITDSSAGVVRCFKLALDYFGVKAEDDYLRDRVIGPPLTFSFGTYFGFDEEQTKKAVEIYRAEYSTKGLHEFTMFEGMDELFRRLFEAGCKVVLATSKPQVFSEQILDDMNVRQYFCFVSGAELSSSGRNKKTDIMRYALEQCKIEKNEVIMVGDTKFDVDSSSELGIPCIGVTFGFGSREELLQHGADFVVDSVKELSELLLVHRPANSYTK